MILYILQIIITISLNTAETAFPDVLLLLTSIFLLCTTTQLFPFAVAITSIIRISAFRHFGSHQIELLENTKIAYSFAPTLLGMQVILSLKHSSVRLARKILIKSIFPLVSSLFLYLLAGMGLAFAHPHLNPIQVLDILSFSSSVELDELSGEAGALVARLWLIFLSFIFYASLLSIFSNIINVVLHFYDACSRKEWSQRWRPADSTFLQLYTLPGEGLWRLVRHAVPALLWLRHKHRTLLLDHARHDADSDRLSESLGSDDAS